ncbi:MAG: hypothetical protein Q8P66_02075 [Candidatus Colwellbacteria bacterium]|nr:hypothetical protein [Candidatus Colwellbacteria bacterium]
MSKFNLQKLTTKINSAYVGAVLVQPARALGEPTAPIKTAQGVVDAINQVANFLFAVFLALAVIFLIVAALFYLTAAGNQTQLDKAKNTLIYSIVAIVIALIAGGLTAFIGDILGTRAL